MLAFKCELCGTYYDHYMNVEGRQTYNSFSLDYMNTQGHIVNSKDSMNLCPNCMKDLWEFIDEKQFGTNRKEK